VFGSVPESSVSPARIPLISNPCPRKTDGDADMRLAAEGLHVNLRSFLTREWDSRIGLARRERVYLSLPAGPAGGSGPTCSGPFRLGAR